MSAGCRPALTAPLAVLGTAFPRAAYGLTLATHPLTAAAALWDQTAPRADLAQRGPWPWQPPAGTLLHTSLCVL